MTRTVACALTVLVSATVAMPALAQAPPSAARIAELSEQWVDPVTYAPPGTAYKLFETAARGKGTKGSYLIYLPPSYEKDNGVPLPGDLLAARGVGNARQGDWAVAHLDRGMRARLVPEAIVVLAQALPVGWYVNSKSGKYPVEDVIIGDLVPHVEQNIPGVQRHWCGALDLVFERARQHVDKLFAGVRVLRKGRTLRELDTHLHDLSTGNRQVPPL